MEKKKVVIALGGNALGKDVEEQKEAVAKTAKVIVDLAQQGLDIIVTHGNGPQVGMIQNAMDNLVVMHENYKQVPLPTSVAMSQGYIGIDLQNAIKYELYSRNIEGKVSTILSQVEVDKNDPAFENPTKPIGRFLTKEEAEENEANGVRCMEDAGRGYRVVVASPMPQRIRELETIKTLVNAGHIVITCGGGGIPVMEQGIDLHGASAIIEKDLASELLAEELDADTLLILTSVEKVSLNKDTDSETLLGTVSVDDANKYIAENQFAAGSMLPKIEAAVSFASKGSGHRTIITDIAHARDGYREKTGTIIK